jgi:hypothetical protein
MKPDVRIYGELRGVSPEAWDRLREDMPLFGQADLRGSTATIEHEGFMIDLEDVEAFLDAAVPLCSEGHLDYIDNQAWTMARFVIEDGRLRSRKVGLNAVLEGLRTS